MLGTGKFSTVYMCTRRGQPNRRYALKAVEASHFQVLSQTISTCTGDTASLSRIYEEIAIMREPHSVNKTDYIIINIFKE